MSVCKKCDRCGTMYENYNYPNSGTTDYNGLIFTSFDDTSNRYASRGSNDLCPDCMKQFKKWFNNEEAKGIHIPPEAMNDIIEENRNHIPHID